MENDIRLGKFVALEGVEGAGKTTIIKQLKLHFEGRSDVVFTREPGGTRLAEHIRGLFLRFGGDPIFELMMVFAARRHHVMQVIWPALLSGKHVICDRFAGSTFAYQLYAQGHQHELLDLFCKLQALVKMNGVEWYAKDGVHTNFIAHYIFLDVSPEVGLERKRKEGKALNSMDKRNLDFHQRVSEGYKEFREISPYKLFWEKSCKILDASQNPEKVYTQTLAEVNSILFL